MKNIKVVLVIILIWLLCIFGLNPLMHIYCQWLGNIAAKISDTIGVFLFFIMSVAIALILNLEISQRYYKD